MTLNKEISEEFCRLDLELGEWNVNVAVQVNEPFMPSYLCQLREESLIHELWQ